VLAALEEAADGYIEANGHRRAKLLDFGIATMLQLLQKESIATTGVRLCTPDYASPERMRGGADGCVLVGADP
jgi:serine/threonine protein kinase